MAQTPTVPARVRALVAQFADPKPMRRGSLGTRYVKCSKPGCGCAERPGALEQRRNADPADHAGPPRPCPCGAMARYVGRRAKRFESVLGPLTLERAYYPCAACDSGVSPRDQHLGLVGTSLSPAVTRMIGLVGALVSFAEGSDLVRELAGVPVTH